MSGLRPVPYGVVGGQVLVRNRQDRKLPHGSGSRVHEHPDRMIGDRVQVPTDSAATSAECDRRRHKPHRVKARRSGASPGFDQSSCMGVKSPCVGW